MPNSESVVYFLLVGDHPLDGGSPSISLLTWCSFYDLSQSAKFQVCCIRYANCDVLTTNCDICRSWRSRYQPKDQLVQIGPAKEPVGPNWTSKRTSWYKLDQPKNQLIKIGPAKGPVPFGWFKLDQPKDQAKDQLFQIDQQVLLDQSKNQPIYWVP